MSDLTPGPSASGVPEGKVPIVESAKEAWRFARDNALRFLPAMGVMALAFAYYQSEIMGWSAQPNLTALAMKGFVYLVATTVVMCAFLRASVRRETSGVAGMNFGLDELRYLGVVLALSIAVGIAAFFIAFVLIIIFVGMAAQSGVDFETAAEAGPEAMAEVFAAVMSSGGGMLLGVLVLLIGVFYAWFSLRLTLFLPATIGERRMMVFQTWAWTKGNAWRILGALALTLMPPAILGSVVTNTVLDVALGDMPFLASDTQRFIANLPAGVLNAFISLLWAGLVARLYFGLRPSD